MPGKKKRFPCGHLGRGQYCHRCAEVEREQRAQQEAKAARKAHLAAAPIPVDHLPADIADKAIEIMQALRAGASYLDFKGKRLKNMGQREVISVPLGRRYRLICRDRPDGLAFVEAISHEVYNDRLAAGGWS